MKRYFAHFMVSVVAMFLASCGGNGPLGAGSPAPAPANVNVVAGDSNAIVTWDMQPGVEYWIYSAVYDSVHGVGVTPQNCGSMQACRTFLQVTSPTVVPGLTNGITFSFSIDGRMDGGKGGPGSPSVQATPRLAGYTWNANSPLGGSNLYSVTYGGVFVAVGAQGAIYTSVDGITWIPSANPVPGVDLYAVAYNDGVYLAVGARGLILTSRDTLGWTQQFSETNSDLYAISGRGTSGYAVVGANGTVLISPDFVQWSNYPSGTTSALYGVTYSTNLNIFVAVGAAGTVITSPDGGTWTPYYLPQYDLKSVTSAAGGIVAVGAQGALVTSPDALTWTLQSPISSTLLNAITYGHQYIAVDNFGSIFTSPDALNWQQVAFQTTPFPLYSVIPAQYVAGQFIGEYVYSAVGAGGTNLIAQ